MKPCSQSLHSLIHSLNTYVSSRVNTVQSLLKMTRGDVTSPLIPLLTSCDLEKAFPFLVPLLVSLVQLLQL